jgi:hypothetical protein
MYRDESNKNVKFLHNGAFGRYCDWMETLRPLCYLVWTNEDLRRLFLESKFARGLEPRTKKRFFAWLLETEKHLNDKGALVEKQDGLQNFLCMAEFIISLRGMPEIPQVSFEDSDEEP